MPHKKTNVFLGLVAVDAVVGVVLVVVNVVAIIAIQKRKKFTITNTRNNFRQFIYVRFIQLETQKQIRYCVRNRLRQKKKKKECEPTNKIVNTVNTKSEIDATLNVSDKKKI